MSEPMRIYEGEGDQLLDDSRVAQKIILLPDSTETKLPESQPKLRIMWGQHLLEDILAGRYRSLVCGVNAQDNRRGIIGQVAALLPTSQWDHSGITAHCQRLVQESHVSVVKFDMDAVEVLGILRPASRAWLTTEDLAVGFKMVAEMIHRRPQRWPTASVSFLGGQVNRLHNSHDLEPSFEAVLRIMYEAGYAGDVYPAPAMWECAPTTMFARFPFPASLEAMRSGGF